MVHPCAVTGQLIDLESGIRTFEMMREIVALIDPACFEMDPIAALERMGEAGSHIACSPLIYGYVNYSIDGFRPNLVAFADIPPREMMVLPARRWAARASVFRLFQQIAPRLSISPTGLPEARCNEGHMRQRVVNRLIPTLGKTKLSMRRRQASTRQRARRLKLPGCAHAIKVIWTFKKPLQIGSMRGFCSATLRGTSSTILNALFRQSFAG